MCEVILTKNDRNRLLRNFLSDEFDHFQQVKRKQQNYNELLENFVMEQQNQQRKQFRVVNDEEFSDEVNIRVKEENKF